MDKAQPRAFFGRAGHAIETVEDAVLVVLRHARSLVQHAELDLAFARPAGLRG